jgi:hypothetical protein
LQEPCQEIFLILVIFCVGAMANVIATARKQVPRDWWNQHTRGVSLGRQYRQYCVHGFLEDILWTYHNIATKMVFAMTFEEQSY